MDHVFGIARQQLIGGLRKECDESIDHIGRAGHREKFAGPLCIEVIDGAHVDHRQPFRQPRLTCSVSPGLRDDRRRSHQFSACPAPELEEPYQPSICSIKGNQCASIEDQSHAAENRLGGSMYGTPASAASARSSSSSNAPFSSWKSINQLSTRRPRNHVVMASLTTADNGRPAACAASWTACRTSAGSETVTRSVLILDSVCQYALVLNSHLSTRGPVIAKVWPLSGVASRWRLTKNVRPSGQLQQKGARPATDRDGRVTTR